MQPIDKTIQSEAPSFEELFPDEETGLEHLFNRKFLAEATPAPQARPAKEDPWADLSVAFTKPTPRITLDPEPEPEPEPEREKAGDDEINGRQRHGSWQRRRASEESRTSFVMQFLTANR